jgi:ABC-type uncharacterized transport system ATPase subunit
MIQYLAKRHGSGEILWARNVTFSVEQRQVFGIIGHNGAVNTQATARRFWQYCREREPKAAEGVNDKKVTD